MSEEPDEVVQEIPREPEKKARAPQRILTRQQKLRYFLIGLLGWWLVNVPLWLILLPVPLSQMTGYQAGEGVILCLMPILLTANIFVLIFMAFVNRWIALGIVTAFAVNLVISLVLGMVFNATCWVPFTTPIEWR